MIVPVASASNAAKPRTSIDRHADSRVLHIPSLDGVRAVAVMMVFLSHAGLGHIVPGGFGVTVFFFLSGYLITSLLREEFRKHDSINLKNFYFRRVIRIWPPLYLTLAIVAALCWLGAFGLRSPESRPLLYQLLHLGNYYQIFGHQTGMPGTGILWSLAVEEHFYLVWPLLFVALYGRLSRAQFSMLLVGICLTVLAWRCVLVWRWSANEWRTYLATDTRIDSILFGCILAIWRNPNLDDIKKHRVCVMLLLVALSSLTLLATFAIRSSDFRETFRYSIQGLALMPLLYVAVNRANESFFRWLNHPALRLVGVLSYSIYLSHFFVLHLLSESSRWTPWISAVLAAAISVCFALGIQLLVDRPLMVFRRRLRA
ncbi:MAG: acyltransferase [Planctomycetota bacterium]|nr:acyltransferase [Planctomycetota bacterium]